MSKKGRVRFAEIVQRITGISTPVFGINWNPSADKRSVVKRLIAFLEDRRALYEDYCNEYGPWVEKSVLEMRQELTNVLKSCPDDAVLTNPIRAMRAACRKFLNELGHPGGHRSMRYPGQFKMWEELGKMRAIFGLHLARLCVAFGVDVEPELASIFPQPDEEDEAS